jgi:hypothetical protein
MIDLLKPAQITRSADHRYRYKDVWYPGTTGILKVLGANFSQASNYGAKHASLAAVDLAAELPKMIETLGREAAAKAVAQAGNKYRDEKAAAGTEVHMLADLVVRGEPTPAMSEVTRKHVMHYAEWWKASGWTLSASEAMLVNQEFGYGGTLDLLARDRDQKRVLADIKTGGVYREASLQLTAYGMASLIETEQGLFTMPEVDRYVILHVTADKPVEEIEVNVGSLERVAWAACMDIHLWIESTKGRKP